MSPADPPQHRRRVVVTCADGLHARVATAIVASVAASADTVTVSRDACTVADARSGIELMMLQIGHSDIVTISATGPTALATIDAVHRALTAP